MGVIIRYGCRRALTEGGQPTAISELVLPQQVVGPGPGRLLLTVQAPDGYRFNSLGPHGWRWRLGRPIVAWSISPSALAWRSDARHEVVQLYARLAPGHIALEMTGVVYCGRTGHESLCLARRVLLTVPVDVSPVAADSTIRVHYQPPGVSP